MRVKLTIEYDGSQFFGWQKQNDFISVQETIEDAIAKVFNTSERIELYGAGRTDTGVHATGQVAHFDIKSPRLQEIWKDKLSKLVLAVNFYLLNKGCVVVNACEVPDDFHARFSAKIRSYRYLIYNRNICSVLNNSRMWHVAKPLNTNLMHEAAQDLLGTHDLEAFRSAHCYSRHAIRTINSVSVQREDDLVFFDISARSFLHNQVRITVGTLKQIGEGKFPQNYIKHLLDSKDRTQAGETAPPHGLYLVNVTY